jgi:hypothetical protein
MQAIGIELPKLPELNKEDIAAVQGFLPGKALSRLAALLALVVLVLGFAGAVDQGLKRLLDVDLSPTPWLRYGLLVGLPLLAVASQLIVEWRAERGRRALRRGVVRAVLNGLCDAALARPLDPINGVWELSHDFVARAVARFLGRRRHRPLQRAAFYAAPAIFGAMLLVTAGALAWYRYSPYEIRSELAELGLTVTPTADGLVAQGNARLTPESFPSTIPLLARLPPLWGLDLSGTRVDNVAPLKGPRSGRSISAGQTSLSSNR